VSIPAPLLDDLQYLSARLGVSRSALISELLGDTVPVVADLLRMHPADDSPDELRRFRGASIDVIRGRIAELQSAVTSFEIVLAEPAARRGAQ